MKITETLMKVADELCGAFSELNETQLMDLEKAILSANRIFVAGAGRSLLMIRGMAMRLMHMGFTAYVVGETVTPAIGPGDLLVIASGSGSTGTLVVMAEKCKRFGARLGLITANPDSPIGRLSDVVVEIKAATPKSRGNEIKSIQPGANTFEQTVLLLGDTIVTHIVSGASLDKQNTELMLRHANLE